VRIKRTREKGEKIMEDFPQVIRKKMAKAFEPEVAISVIHLGKTNIATAITKEIHLFLAGKHLVMLDSDNGVIYLKRKEKT